PVEHTSRVVYGPSRVGNDDAKTAAAVRALYAAGGWIQPGGSGFAQFGGSCHSQLGCPPIANPVSLRTIKQAANEFAAKATTAAAYKEELPKINADRRAAFERMIYGQQVKCKANGIPNLFAAAPGSNYDPDAFNFALATPALSAGEAAI